MRQSGCRNTREGKNRLGNDNGHCRDLFSTRLLRQIENREQKQVGKPVAIENAVAEENDLLCPYSRLPGSWPEPASGKLADLLVGSRRAERNGCPIVG
jgi:hypothetical protein